MSVFHTSQTFSVERLSRVLMHAAWTFTFVASAGSSEATAIQKAEQSEKQPYFTSERILNLQRADAHNGKYFFVDLDLGRLVTPPFPVQIDSQKLPYNVIQPQEPQLSDWLVNQGVDLIVTVARPVNSATGHRVQTRSVRTLLKSVASGLQPHADGSWTWKTQPAEIVALFARKDDSVQQSGFVPNASSGSVRPDSPDLRLFRTTENILGLYLLEQPAAVVDELRLRIVHVASGTTPMQDLSFGRPPVSGKQGPADPLKFRKDKGGLIGPAAKPAEKHVRPAEQPDKRASTVKGLEFLATYPKLRDLSLNMTKKEFLAIVERRHLTARKPEDDRDHYYLPTADGHTVIVMFGNNGNKCRGIQRLRGEDIGAAPPESWEITRIYGEDWLRKYFVSRETLPKPIIVPAVTGEVVDTTGLPVVAAMIASHTPRHWLRLKNGGTSEFNNPASRQSKKDGTFAIPQRTEPYRVLVTHESGVSSMSHEQLIRANGRIVLQPWATVDGTFVLDGQPMANERLMLRPDTLPWSYSSGGPRLMTEFKTVTDQQGRFSFTNVPPLSGMLYHHSSDSRLERGRPYPGESGKTTTIDLGQGHTITGRLLAPTGQNIDWKKTHVIVQPDMQPAPYPAEIQNDDQDARQAWYIEWQQTEVGRAFRDERAALINIKFYPQLKDDGSFRLAGVPSGHYRVAVTRNVDSSDLRVTTLAKKFAVDESTDHVISLGDFLVDDLTIK